MANAAADELARFRRNLARAELPELLAVVEDVIESAHEVIDQVGAAADVVEMARAVIAELRRRRHAMQPPSLVGNA